MNVAEACANTPSVTKLVLTSCLFAILWDRENYSETGAILEDKNMTDLDFYQKQKLQQSASATVRGLDLIVMNPATVVGPMLGMDMNNNVQNLLDKSGVFALAYILAQQVDRAAGRYICFEKLLSKSDIVEAARQMYPNYPIARYAFSYTYH